MSGEEVTIPVSDLENLVEQKVEEKVEGLREEKEELRRENEALRKRVDGLEQEISVLDAEIGEVSKQLDGFDTWREAISNWKEITIEELWELEDQIEAIETGRSGELTDFTEESIAEMLPIEKLTRLPETVAKEQLDTPQSRNLYRARFVWESFDEYTQTVGSGSTQKLRITSSEMMRVLSAAETGTAVSRARLLSV